jgi:soluble lytic murein transglycosylase-like protein
MRQVAFRFLVVVIVAVADAHGQDIGDPQEQVNRLLAGLHDRVDQAAKAAADVVKVDDHLRKAQRLVSAGEGKEAHAELELAAEVVRAADRSATQHDLLLEDYAWKVRYALNSVRGTHEEAAKVEQYAADGSGLFAAVQHALVEHALPPQLSAVAIIESGGDPNALSPKGARGLWQLMPDTARRYGLRVDSRVDDRLDPIKSTQAAVRYLRDLYDMFHDWPLALAAYNAGENRLQNVMNKTGIHRFSELAERRLLPSETIQYVPAVMNMMTR